MTLLELDWLAPLTATPPGPDLEGFLYRANFDKFNQEITFAEIPIVKRTERGVWAMDWKRRFILSSSRKRYAYPTKREALVSFIARRTKHISLLSYQHDDAVESLKAAQALQDSGVLPTSRQPTVPDAPKIVSDLPTNGHQDSGNGAFL